MIDKQENYFLERKQSKTERPVTECDSHTGPGRRDSLSSARTSVDCGRMKGCKRDGTYCSAVNENHGCVHGTQPETYLCRQQIFHRKMQTRSLESRKRCSNCETDNSLYTQSQTSSLSSTRSSLYSVRPTLCKCRNSVKICSSNALRGGSNRLLYLVFVCLLFSSSLLMQVQAESCTKCPPSCDCEKVDDLCEVNCSRRKLTVLPTSDELEAVSRMNLSRNEIRSFSSDHSDYLSSLKSLDLSHNEITEIPVGSFSGLTNLQVLLLHENRLSQLSKALFDDLPSLKNLTLSGNNWRCDCGLHWLQDLLNGSSDLSFDVIDGDNVLCTDPKSIQNQTLRSVDLNTVKCASSYVSCYRDPSVDNHTVIIWEYTNLESAIVDRVACKAECYALGYTYATVYSLEEICLCASLSAETVAGSSLCGGVCNDVVPSTVCSRKVVTDEVLLACFSPKFDGIRRYSQLEAVEISIITKHTTVSNYMWNFNDSTAVIYTEKSSVVHKYALAGLYYVTITVSCGEIFQTYSFPINIEEPMGKVTLQCDASAAPGQTVVTAVDVGLGTRPRLMWSSSRNGEALTHDTTFMPDGSAFYEDRRTAYRVLDEPSDWFSSKSTCEENGGLLAVVDGDDVNTFLSELVKDLADRIFWIGAADGRLGGTFFFVNGHSISHSTYQNWAENEPDEEDTSNHCVSFDAANSGKWYSLPCSTNLPFICQYRSQDHAAEPKHFIAGTTLFGSSSTSSLKNLTEQDSSPLPAGEKVYTLLFPGLWIQDGGVTSSWEFTGPTRAQNRTIQLQIYRPTCPSPLEVSQPGCPDSPFLSCASIQCSRKIATCSAGQQYCPITESCKALSEPCSAFAQGETRGSVNLNRVSYTLLSRRIVNVPGDNSEIYQLVVGSGQRVRADDVIAVSFSHSTIDPADVTVKDLPLLCQHSNLSIWRQDALLVQTDGWASHDEALDLSSKSWMEAVWCDIRLHYSKKSEGSISGSTFLKPAVAGNYTYTVTAFNNVSQSDSPASCTVEVKDKVVSVTVIGPVPKGTSPSGHPILHMASGVSQNIAVEVEGGGPNVTVEWQGMPDGVVVTSIENVCPVQHRSVPECAARAGEELRVSSTDVFFSDDNSTEITITARNAYSSQTITVRVEVHQNITGLQILPAGTGRILASVPQVFTAHVETGSGVTYSWVVDDLIKFKYTGLRYNVLFRTPAEYVLKLQAENSVATVATEVTLTVDQMNKLKDLDFKDLPTILPRDTPLTIEATFLVDENVDYQVEWTINKESSTDPVVSQPHTGTRPDSDVERVPAETSTTSSFSTTGEKEIQVRIYNDYDSITKTATVDVREPLVEVSVEMVSEVPAVGDPLQFQGSGVPSTYGARFKYDYGDGQSDPFSDQADVTHTFDAPGTYTVNMTVDNEINAKWNTTTVTVYERVTGLTLSTDGPTEIGLVSTVTATIATGTASAVYSFDFDQDTLTPVVNSSSASSTVTYLAVGRYNVSVTAQNLISMQQEFIEVHVFPMDIVEVNTSEACVKKDSVGTLQAFMETDVVTLFDYKWTFEDRSFEDIDSNNTLDHVFTTVGEHNVTVRVTSKATGVYDEEFAIVCVQGEIQSVSITSDAAVEVGQQSVFTLSVTGGTNSNYSVDFGDGTPVVDVTLPSASHNYSSPGNYTVTFIAENLVGTVTDTALAVVQEAIKNVTISTSSSYEPLIARNLNVTYSASTSAGTDLHYTWDFGDGSPPQSGKDVVHAYTSAGTYTVAVTVSNLISGDSATLIVTVKEPVSGAAIIYPAAVVRVNTSVDFTASAATGGPGEKYYWKVTPGSSADYTLGLASFSHVFPEIKNYSVAVKIENEVSADYAEVFILAADIILGVNISTEALAEDRYAARNESTKFEALLATGESISSTTAGDENSVTSYWTIEINGALEESYQGSSVIFHSFEQTGLYTVKVNISNGVSFKESQVEVASIDRVGSISFIVIDGFEGAAQSGEAVKIMAIVSVGTDIEFFWDPDDGTTPASAEGENLTHIYSTASTYYPYVTAGNVLGNETDSYELVVQDGVTGLEITQVNAIAEFYVPYMQTTDFQASIVTGTDVSFSWYYVDRNGILSDIENSTDLNMKWQFPEVTTYMLIVNASNLVSWDQVNHTVTVLQAVYQLEIKADLVVATGSLVQLNATILAGDDVTFIFFVDGLVKEGFRISDKISSINHTFVTPGEYEVTVQASNNVSRTNVTKTISVRDAIEDPQIGGCCVSGQYVATGENLTFTAVLASGTNVSYEWQITYETGEVLQDSGPEIHKVLTVPGATEVSLSVDNGVSSSVLTMMINLQERCFVLLTVEDIGRSMYIDENVTVHIKILQGTNVTHNVTFGDGSPLLQTEKDLVLHAYRTAGDYTITVVSYNRVGPVTNTRKVSIYKIECTPPSISVVESTRKSKFLRSRAIYVESKVEINCTAYDVTYTWQIYRQDNCTDLDPANLVNVALGRRPLLIVPALTLEVHMYCFRIEVAYEDTYLYGTDTVLINVLFTPLTVVVIGGTTRFIYQNEPLVLDGSYSFDPDLPGSSSGISYLWSCNSSDALPEEEYGYDSGNATTRDDTCIPATALNEPMFTLPAGVLSDKKQYDYTLVASKLVKTASATQRIVVVSRPIPTATIICFSCYSMASYVVSSSFHLGLKGSCDNCNAGDEIIYIWEVLKLTDDNTQEDFPVNSITTTTGGMSQHLVIKEGALDNHTYEFKLKIRVNGAEGYSKLLLRPNQPPVSGTCSMSYSGETVYALTTSVSFSCSGWTDEGNDNASPLVYTIIAYRHWDAMDSDTFILYRGTQESYAAYLPLGLNQQSNIINVKISVEDQLGTSAEGLDVNVTVLNDPLSSMSWLIGKVERELDRLLKLNDPQDIIDFSAAAITVLNQMSSENGYGSADEHYTSRVYIRERLTVTVSAIETNNLKEVQQLASVLEQCVKVPAEMQNTDAQLPVLRSVENMVAQLGEFVLTEGQKTFQKATNDVLDIVGGLIRVVNLVVYDSETATAIKNMNMNVTINHSEAYRQEMILNLTSNVHQLVSTVLSGKVLGEESVTFLSPTVTVTGVKTTASTAIKDYSVTGVYCHLPSDIFAQLNPDDTILAFAMSYMQNPYTYGYPPHSLSSTGFANITSRVPTIEFTYPNGTAISISDLAAYDDGHEQRIKLVMAESSWTPDSGLDALEMVNTNGSLYRPRDGLSFDMLDLLQPLQTMAITVTNNNRDPDTAVHIMVTYKKKYPNNKADNNPSVGVYFDYSPKPNKENNSAVLLLDDAVMADGVDHQRYTFFLDPRYNATTTPELYLNVSNYFSYEIMEIDIAVYYSLCLFYDDTHHLWSPEGLFPSAESTYSASVCYSNHLTSFGSFVINPPNLVSVTEVTDIDFSQNPIALITVSAIMFLYIVGMIWARKLDLRDIKRASLIPLCGNNGSFKYEITIKTAAGMGSGTTANVGICVYGYERRSGSRHLARKGAFQRGAVDTMQIASDVSLGEIQRIKLWHDNTGLDPAWCVDRVMVRDLHDDRKYYFLVNSWLQVYPDDEDETCLEKVVRVATEEELTNFSNIFGSQLSYGWEDAHLWLSVIERPARSRFTRVQRVTCCVTLLLTFMLFSAMWYQGYDPNGEVVPEDTLVGIIRWKDIAVGAIVSLMVFPISLLFVCVFKKSRNKVDAVKPWLDRAQTAQTIEIWDEIIEGGARRSTRTASGLSDLDDDYDDDDITRKHRNQLPGQDDFLAEYLNENAEGASLFQSRVQTPISRKSKLTAYEAASGRSKLHKSSGTVKSLDIKEKVWSDATAAAQRSSGTPSSSSGVTGSIVDLGISSGEERASSSSSAEWPNRTDATKKGLLHNQSIHDSSENVQFVTTSLMEKDASAKKPLRRSNTAYVRSTGSASPPNYIPDDEDDEFDPEIWEAMSGESANMDGMPADDSLVFTNKQVVLRRTRRTKFGEETLHREESELSRGLALDDVLVNQSDEDSDDSDVPLPEFPMSRGNSRNVESRASTFIGTSPQPSSEEFLLPHWCIYVNYVACFATMAICIFFIILYGNAFGPDTTKRWLLSMFVALLESFFLVEPLKVILFAVFLAMITKPINPEEKDNLVEEPLVETYGTVDSYSKVRAPGGFALDKCKKEAQKTKRSDKMLLNLAIYLLFLSSVAAVASWDRDTMGYYNTMAVKKSLFETFFTLERDAEGPRWTNESATFYEIRTVTDIWAWLDQLFAVKIFESKGALENQNLNNMLLGEVRLRQQRSVSEACVVDTARREYNGLTYIGQECLGNYAGSQQTSSFGPGWTDDSTGNLSWEYSDAQIHGVKYWGEDLVYDDSGYSNFLNSTSTVESAQLELQSLQLFNWIDRETRVVFVEFTQLNPATYWFTVCVVMFEMGVTGAVRPSYSIQTVRMYRPSTAFYVDMFFMSLIGITVLLLLLREMKKIRDPKITPVLYFTKWTNWVNLTVLALSITLCVLYVYREVYMEEVLTAYVNNKTGFTNFYKVAFFANLVTCTACVLLAVIIVRSTRIFRYIKCWSVFGNTIVASAQYLLGAALMLAILILAFAMLGYLVYGQSYTQVVEDFRDFPNSIYAMVRSFRGRLDFRVCYDYSPFFTIFFFFTFYFMIFWIFCRIFAAILINEYKYVKARKEHLRTDIPDYEILNHLITRIKMRLGIIKPKQFRPMVRFEGMSTPSSRGSFMSLDSFDTCFMPGRISQCSYATGISSSSSDSGLGTPSDHSLSVYDYLTLEQPSDRPMDPKHLDFLCDRLSNYSVDMLLHHFDRVNQLGDDVLGLESDLLEVTERVVQRKKMQSQSKEIALAASSMTLQPNYISPDSDSKHSEGSATTFSSRGHFSLQSQQTSSQASLSTSGRRSTLSTDSRFQTVLSSMFPTEQRLGGISDLSQTELNSLREQPVVRSRSYTGPSYSQKTRNMKGDERGTISSANSVLRSDGSTRQSKMVEKKRPHSDEGVRGNATTSIISETGNRGLYSVGNRLAKQSSKTELRGNKMKPNTLTMTKKSAW